MNYGEKVLNKLLNKAENLSDSEYSDLFTRSQNYKDVTVLILNFESIITVKDNYINYSNSQFENPSDESFAIRNCPEFEFENMNNDYTEDSTLPNAA